MTTQLFIETYRIIATCDKQHHDDIIKWKHFPRYWPFERGIHQWPVNSPHKGQWRGASMFAELRLKNGGANNRDAGDLRGHRAHYDATVMIWVLVSVSGLVIGWPHAGSHLIYNQNWFALWWLLMPWHRIGARSSAVTMLTWLWVDCCINHINSSCSVDDIWRYKSILSQVMVWRLTEPNHFLKLCWLITSKVQWRSPEYDLPGDTSTINHWN